MLRFVLTIAFLSLCLISFLNLGKILDKSDFPKESDVIISLGGDDNHRIKKAIELYENSFSKKRLIIITGGTEFTKRDNKIDSRIKYINSLNKEINYIYNPDTKTTAQELIYLKKYLFENNLKKAIIVSNAFHTRRIKMLIDILGFDEDIELSVVKTEVPWWDDKEYYKNSLALKLALSEVLKIPYNYIKYKIL